ncbi:MAG: M48 family metallopeptidase [Phycisphaeraceae bacterium]
MQILLLGLFVALFLHDAATAVTEPIPGGAVRTVEAMPADAWPYLGPLPVLAIVLLPKLLLALIYQAACMRTRRRLGREGGQRALDRLEKLTSALPLVLLGLFACDLSFGYLRVVRLALPHTVLIDELVVLLPTLMMVLLSWWSYYPVDRRLREAAIFRHADEGRPIYPLLTRGGYLSMQARHQFGLLLLPLLAVYAWTESMALLGPGHAGWLTPNQAYALTPLGVFGVFVLAPLVIRFVWQTAPLADGEVRERMLAMCRLHRVRVRELLVWRTGGGMVNAAVTGLVRQVRYILLSDGLLDQMSPRTVEAVMAHEIAHVKCRHIVWMVLVLIASLGLIEFVMGVLFDAALSAYAWESMNIVGSAGPAWFDLYDTSNKALVLVGPTFVLAILIFGWVSRRIERQADVFAARHLAQSADDHKRRYDNAGQLLFDDDSIHTMVHALQRVAQLNHASVHRPSWRHGSIAWRQAHLRSLVGMPVHDTPVDRVLTRVKTAALLALAVLLLTTLGDVGDLPRWLGI